MLAAAEQGDVAVKSNGKRLHSCRVKASVQFASMTWRSAMLEPSVSLVGTKQEYKSNV